MSLSMATLLLADYREIPADEERAHIRLDAYNDDLSYWLAGSSPHLVIPYTLVNDDA